MGRWKEERIRKTGQVNMCSLMGLTPVAFGPAVLCSSFVIMIKCPETWGLSTLIREQGEGVSRLD